MKPFWGVEIHEVASVSNENISKTNVEVKLFGIVNVKNISVTSIEKYEVVPLGKLIGLKLYKY